MVLAVISYNGKQHCCSLFWVKSVVIWLLMIDMGWVCRDSIWLHSWCRNTLNKAGLYRMLWSLLHFLVFRHGQSHFLPQAPEALMIIGTTFSLKYMKVKGMSKIGFFSSGVYRSFGLTIILWRLHSVTILLSLAHQNINSQRADIMSYSSSCPQCLEYNRSSVKMQGDQASQS